MWTVARYLPVSPFSLRSAVSTSSGGKTLLTPTPFAIKMALTEVAIRLYGKVEGERLFPIIRDLEIAASLPLDLVVMKSFGKIRRLYQSKAGGEKALEASNRAKEIKNYPFQTTIAYREYVHYRGQCIFAFRASDNQDHSFLSHLLTHINYFGKRGGFFQITAYPHRREELDSGFVKLTGESSPSFHVAGTLQMVDDCGRSLTFQKANIYTADRITLHKERIFHHIVLPYQLLRSSRRYSWYRLIEEM